MNVEKSIAFRVGRGFGVILATLLFALIFTFLSTKFSFNFQRVILVFVIVLVLTFAIQGMMKKRWL